MAKFTKIQQRQLYEIASSVVTVKPFMNDTPEQRAERIRRVKQPNWKGFSYFCMTYFPHIFDLPFCDCHKDMFVITEMNTPGITGITGFRGLGKTVLMAVVYPIWRIILGDQYIVSTASNEKLASVRTAFMRNELNHNARLTYDYPKLETRDNDDLYYHLQNNTLIQALSIKQQHRGLINPRTGKRPDMVICDDIDEDANIGNQSIGRKKRDKIIGDVFGCLQPGKGRILWLGNLVHPNYGICQFEQLLCSDIKAVNPTASPEKRRHLFSEKKVLLKFGLENARGESRWEEQYPTVFLPALRQQYGPTAYQREMLGIAITEGNIFRATWFQKWSRLPAKFKLVWLFTDPASGTKGCFKSIEAFGDDGFHWFQTANWLRQTSNNAYFKTLYDICTNHMIIYGVRFRMAIDTSYGQTTLKEFDRWAMDNGKKPIGHLFKRINLKENKQLRIERLDTVIESGKVQFCPDQDYQTLQSQFLTYPQGYIDGPDAVAGCLERFEGYNHGRGKIRVRGGFGR